MKIYKVGLPFIGMSSLMLLMSPLANAAEMPSMDHSGMDMSDMDCLLYTSPSPRDRQKSRMPSSA